MRAWRAVPILFLLVTTNAVASARPPVVLTTASQIAADAARKIRQACNDRNTEPLHPVASIDDILINVMRVAGKDADYPTVITLVGHEETPLGKGGDHVFVNFAEDDTSCESFYLQSLFIALAVLKHRGELAECERMLAELEQLPSLLLGVKRSYEKEAAGFAQKLAASDYHIITGAGNVWPQAWYYGMCILEEMQWIRTRPVHASDFFHGTLELVDKDVSVVLFKGEDSARPLAERVEKFAPTYTDKLTVLDTADFELPGISPDVRALISPIVLATALERVSAHLEVIRNHPLTTRRYYKRVAY